MVTEENGKMCITEAANLWSDKRLTISDGAAVHWQERLFFARTGLKRICGGTNTEQILLRPFVMSLGDSNLLPGNNPLIIASTKFTLNAHIIIVKITKRSLEIVLENGAIFQDDVSISIEMVGMHTIFEQWGFTNIIKNRFYFKNQ